MPNYLKTNITKHEKDLARSIKGRVKDLIVLLAADIDLIINFKDALLKDRPDQKKLKKRYSGKMLRYRRRVIKDFNALLVLVKNLLTDLNQIMDPEMMRLKEIIVAEFDELSDGVEVFLDLLKHPQKENFTQKIEGLCLQIHKRYKSIDNILEDQLVGHIENDILGKMKISKLKSRIIKRTRIIRNCK